MANFDLRNFLTENKLTRVSKTLNENLNFSGGEKAAEEFDIDANNGVGIADFLKSMLGHYERIAGEEAVFYELSSEDAAILKMLGFNHLNGEEADM